MYTLSVHAIFSVVCVCVCMYKVQVFVVCRRGNDSQQAVVDLRKHLGELSCDCKEAAAPSTSPSSLRLPALRIRDIAGGLERWADTVDPGFPKY